MKELYNRLKRNCELSIMSLPYIYKTFEGNLVMNNLVLNFNKSDDYNLNRMKSIQDKYRDFFVEWYC